MQDSDKEAQLKSELEGLKEQLKKNREANQNNTLSKACEGVAGINNVQLKLRRTLKGHLAKIFAMQWAQDTPTLASASQDGKLLVWNAVTCLKMNAISLPSNWVMTCGYAGSGDFVASGGLDNTCSVWNVRGQNPTKVSRELQGHDGFLSCCRFIDNRQILTSSGDHTCCLWDAEQGTQTTIFRQHTADVMFLALSNTKSTFVSSGCDHNIVAWDIKGGKSTHIIDCHDKDVNVVHFFPNDTTFASGSDDGTTRIFDLRTWGELARFAPEAKDPAQAPCPTSLAFSQTGRLLFTSYTDNNMIIWDSLKGDRKGDLPNKAHDKRITSIGVSGDGCALCTASWDTFMKIWT